MSSTPSIRISQPQRQSSPPSYSGVQPETASPMPIPKVQDPVPPPLPPPTHIPEISTGQDPGWQWGNDPSSVDFGRSAAVNPGSSLLGGELRSPLHAKELEHTRNSSMDDGRRGSSLSTIAAVQRDHEMPDAQQPQSDEEGASRSRSGSNYRYVGLLARAAFDVESSIEKRQRDCLTFIEQTSRRTQSRLPPLHLTRTVTNT
jgi:hypothetical protein